MTLEKPKKNPTLVLCVAMSQYCHDIETAMSWVEYDVVTLKVFLGCFEL